jgi:hypothetical protein
VPNAALSNAPAPQALPTPNRPAIAVPEVKKLINVLPANLKPKAGIVEEVRVLPNEVHVRFVAGKQITDQLWNDFMAAVQTSLPGKTVKQV